MDFNRIAIESQKNHSGIANESQSKMEGSETTTNQDTTDTCCAGSPPYREDCGTPAPILSLAAAVVGNDTTDTCCGGSPPSRDGSVTAARILSLAALVFSWVFYATFLVGGIAVALQLRLGCHHPRRTKAYILATSGCSYLACLLALGTGLYVGIAFRTRSVGDRFPTQPDTDYVVECHPFTLSHERGRGFSDRSNCSRRTYTAICMVAAILWGLSASCLMVFVKHGRYDRRVQNETEEQDEDDEAVEEESEDDTVPLPVVRSPTELAALEAAALPPEHADEGGQEAKV